MRKLVSNNNHSYSFILVVIWARQIGQKDKSLPQSQHVCQIYRNKLEPIRKHVDVNPGFDIILPDVHIPVQDLFDCTNTQDNSA